MISELNDSDVELVSGGNPHGIPPGQMYKLERTALANGGTLNIFMNDTISASTGGTIIIGGSFTAASL